MRSEWPLVGRSAILDQARQDLRREELSGVVLAGPAGVGKTRLAAEVAEYGAAVGFHVERAVAGQPQARRASPSATWGASPRRGSGLAMTDEPVAMTRREREVAVLAAGGITSKDIADRLFVSVRTVDNHLGRVYDKLGISSRAQLAEILVAVG